MRGEGGGGGELRGKLLCIGDYRRGNIPPLTKEWGPEYTQSLRGKIPPPLPPATIVFLGFTFLSPYCITNVHNCIQCVSDYRFVMLNKNSTWCNLMQFEVLILNKETFNIYVPDAECMKRTFQSGSSTSKGSYIAMPQIKQVLFLSSMQSIQHNIMSYNIAHEREEESGVETIS